MSILWNEIKIKKQYLHLLNNITNLKFKQIMKKLILTCAIVLTSILIVSSSIII